MCNIIMFGPTLILLMSTVAATFAGYAGSSSNSVGNGNGYGYSGSYSGNGGNIPQFPQVPGFDFGAFGAQFDSLQKYHQQFLANGGPYSYSIASSSPNSNAQAQSSITFLGLQQQISQGAAAGGGGGIPAYAPSGGGSYGGGYGGSFSGTDGGAVASGSIGPSGYQQTAAVYPENPNNPNIFSRFGEVSPQSGGGGSYGVFSSSVSSSSNEGGKPQTFHQASTTINDNGKISTYTVKNP